MNYTILLALMTMTFGMSLNAGSNNRRRGLKKIETAIQESERIAPEAKELEAAIAETEAALEQTPADVELALKKAKRAEELELRLQERDRELKRLQEQAVEALKKYKVRHHPEVLPIYSKIAKKKREIQANKKEIAKIKETLD